MPKLSVSESISDPDSVPVDAANVFAFAVSVYMGPSMAARMGPSLATMISTVGLLPSTVPSVAW